MTQTGLRQYGRTYQRQDKSGLTAPGLVKVMTFKGGEGTLFRAKILFYFSQYFRLPHALIQQKRPEYCNLRFVFMTFIGKPHLKFV